MTTQPPPAPGIGHNEPPPAPGPDDNIGTLDKASISKRINALGTAEGKGANSRPGLFLTVVEAARHKIIGTDDVPDVWTRYQQALEKARGAVGYVAMPSEAQQVSKLRAGVRLGELTHVNGVDVVNRTSVIWNALREANEGKPVGGSAFDALVKVARAQVNDQPDSPLSDDQIQGALLPNIKEDPSEADRLDGVLQVIEDILKDKKKLGEVSAESKETLTEAGSFVMTRIRELGGTSRMKKKAAKAEAQAAKMQSNLVAWNRDVVGPARDALEMGV